MESSDNQSDAPQGEVTGLSSQGAPAVSREKALFQQVDWLSFGLATVLTLIVYLWTLAPEVTLEMSGTLATAAMYGGVAHPPGFPLWTVYSWLFTKLLPFSNIAWRVAVGSAVASALTCGVIALLVSRSGAAMVEGLRAFRRLEPKEERLLRLMYYVWSSCFLFLHVRSHDHSVEYASRWGCARIARAILSSLICDPRNLDRLRPDFIGQLIGQRQKSHSRDHIFDF